uniref:Calpastatin n=1 Tax=Romanomermis culicivorax TaxID=13658 RepID=A0A915IEG2_ROMCU
KSGTKTETSSSTTKKLIDPKESATKAVKSAQPPEKTNDLE